MLGKSLEWLSASSADKWVLGKIKAFTEQIRKCQNLKGSKRNYSTTSSSFSQRNFALDIFACFACFWQKIEQHTAPQISPTIPHICYLPPNFHKQNHFPWRISSVHPFLIASSHCTEFMHEHWDSSLLSSYTKMHAKARSKNLLPKSNSDNISVPETRAGRIMQKEWWTNICMNNNYQCPLEKCLSSKSRASMTAVLWPQAAVLVRDYCMWF